MVVVLRCSGVWTSDPSHHYNQNNDSKNSCNNKKNKDGPDQDCRDDSIEPELKNILNHDYITLTIPHIIRII